MFSSRFMLFQTFKKKGVKNKISGGGGGGMCRFFCRKTLLYHFISRFMLFSTFKKKGVKNKMSGGGGGGGDV